MLGDWLEPRLSLDYHAVREGAYNIWRDPSPERAASFTCSAPPTGRQVKAPACCGAGRSDRSGSSASDSEASSPTLEAQAPGPVTPGSSHLGTRRRWARSLLSAGQGALARSWSEVLQAGAATGSRNHLEALGAAEGLVTADTDPWLLEDGILARGPLVQIKGWWRQGPKLAERIAEIRAVNGGTGWQLVWYRIRREGTPDFTQVQRLEDLRGAAVESVELTQHPGLHGFRVHVLPRAREESLDFATVTAAERARWLAAFARAAEHQPEEKVPLSGRLQITVKEASLWWERPAFRRQSFLAPELFALVRWDTLECRSAPLRARVSVGGSCSSSVTFDHTSHFPVADDDPDALVSIEVWAQDSRRRCRPCGRVDVPLYCLGRNHPRKFKLPLRDVMRPRGEGSEVGSVWVDAQFLQPLGSLLLPRQTLQSSRPWHIVGDRPIREQLKEFEAFLREFEVFSSRFMHHCDTWRQWSFMLRRVVQWDSPLITLACLIGLTVVIGFFHEHALPLGVLVLLCVTAWQHPWWRWRERAVEQLPGDADCVRGEQVEPNSVADPQLPPIKARFENERRLILGKFMQRRLRFYDPPPWCDAEGHRVEDTRVDPVEDGVQYVWRVEVCQFTDNDGWQYARCFGRNAMWRSAFQHQMFVRRRKYIGRPAAAPTRAASGSADGSQVSGRPSSFFQRPSTLALVAAARAGGHSGHEGGKGPEFGIAKTPFHDLYQQYLLRWAYLQRQIEFWMDWYERRKNLFLGATLPTQTFALLGVFALLVATWALPTRWLALAWIYTFFYDGLATGRLMRRNQDTFVRALKDTAVTLWLKCDKERARAMTWGPRTLLDEVAETGVQLLVLRDWIRDEFFEGRPMVPLRAVQRCCTLGELAVQVTWTSDHFVRRRQRPRVWYRSTFRNLLDHVPSDVTLFQPLTCQSFGEGSGS